MGISGRERISTGEGKEWDPNSQELTFPRFARVCLSFADTSKSEEGQMRTCQLASVSLIPGYIRVGPLVPGVRIISTMRRHSNQGMISGGRRISMFIEDTLLKLRKGAYLSHV